MLLTDVVLAETVFVMESVYGAPRRRLAEAMRALLVLPAVAVVDQPLLLRTLELYEETRLHLVDAYLVACAESTGVGSVASFDRGIDRVGTVERIEPRRGLTWQDLGP